MLDFLNNNEMEVISFNQKDEIIANEDGSFAIDKYYKINLKISSRNKNINKEEIEKFIDNCFKNIENKNILIKNKLCYVYLLLKPITEKNKKDFNNYLIPYNLINDLFIMINVDDEEKFNPDKKECIMIILKEIFGFDIKLQNNILFY